MVPFINIIKLKKKKKKKGKLPMSSRLTSNLSKSYVIIFYSEFLKSEHILLHQKHLSQEEAIISPVYELNTIRMSTCVGASKREKEREGENITSEEQDV